MKGWVITIMVLGMVVVAAEAQITYQVTQTGSYTVSYGGADTPVNVYKVRYTTNLLYGRYSMLAALVVDIGTSAGLGGSDPFQVGWIDRVKVGGKWAFPNVLTPTEEDIDEFFDPNDGTNTYQTDTRFLPAGIDDWTPAVFIPTETNDMSVYNPGDIQYSYTLGRGSLWCAINIPVDLRAQSMDVATVGVIQGTYVWLKDASYVIDPNTGDGAEMWAEILIPEPMTFCLLGLGGLALFRRRRSTGQSG